MRHSDIPKLIPLLSEVLVSSDIRYFRNLTSHDVLARQGSSLNDIKMAAKEGCREGSKCGLSLKFLITEQFLY